MRRPVINGAAIMYSALALAEVTDLGPVGISPLPPIPTALLAVITLIACVVDLRRNPPELLVVTRSCAKCESDSR